VVELTVLTFGAIRRWEAGQPLAAAWNVASGLYATVPGGAVNTAPGPSESGGWHARPGLAQWLLRLGGLDRRRFRLDRQQPVPHSRNGGVGINTNAPTRMLDVNGVIGVFDSGRAPTMAVWRPK